MANTNARASMDPEVQAYLAELDKLKAENAALKAKAERSIAGKLSIRVSEKGGVSVYGLGRFPVTLYKEQWLKLLAEVESLTQFLADNESKLSTKPAFKPAT